MTSEVGTRKLDLSRNRMASSQSTFLCVSQQKVFEKTFDEVFVAENVIFNQKDHNFLLHVGIVLEEFQKVVRIKQVKVAKSKQIETHFFMKRKEKFEVF